MVSIRWRTMKGDGWPRNTCVTLFVATKRREGGGKLCWALVHGMVVSGCGASGAGSVCDIILDKHDTVH